MKKYFLFILTAAFFIIMSAVSVGYAADSDDYAINHEIIVGSSKELKTNYYSDLLRQAVNGKILYTKYKKIEFSGGELLVNERGEEKQWHRISKTSPYVPLKEILKNSSNNFWIIKVFVDIENCEAHIFYKTL